MKLDVSVKFRKQGSKRCRLWSCLRRTSVLMVPWLWVGVKGHLNIQPMPHKPDNGYHLHHRHNNRYQHHHHPQPYHLNNQHPQASTQQQQQPPIPSSPIFTTLNTPDAKSPNHLLVHSSATTLSSPSTLTFWVDVSWKRVVNDEKHFAEADQFSNLWQV